MAKKAQEAPHKVKTTKEKQLLKVQLTQDELLDAGQRLANLVREQTELESEAKSVASQFKAKIEEKKAGIVKVQSLVHDKYEYRNIPCTRVLDYTDVRCTVTRDDTGEQIESRKLDQDELQMDMGFDGDKEVEAKDGK